MALAGVAEDDRCKGWKTGKCPDASSGVTTWFRRADDQVGHTCPDCHTDMHASNVEMLGKVKEAHKKVGVDGMSQCTVQSEGTRRGSLHEIK